MPDSRLKGILVDRRGRRGLSSSNVSIAQWSNVVDSGQGHYRVHEDKTNPAVNNRTNSGVQDKNNSAVQDKNNSAVQDRNNSAVQENNNFAVQYKNNCAKDKDNTMKKDDNNSVQNKNNSVKGKIDSARGRNNSAKKDTNVYATNDTINYAQDKNNSAKDKKNAAKKDKGGLTVKETRSPLKGMGSVSAGVLASVVLAKGRTLSPLPGPRVSPGRLQGASMLSALPISERIQSYGESSTAWRAVVSGESTPTGANPHVVNILRAIAHELNLLEMSHKRHTALTLASTAEVRGRNMMCLFANNL